MDNAKQATPHNKLIDEIMDCRVPKTEREHAAAREIEMLREALRLPLQSYEPVGRFAKFTDGIWREVTDGSAGIPLYTTPQPQREWVGLTDEEITTCKRTEKRYLSSQEFARAIEAKLWEKNT